MNDIIHETDLARMEFTARDGIFVLTGNQAEYVSSNAGPAVAEARFLCLSLHARAELLRLGRRNVMPPDGLVTDAEVRAIRHAATPHDRVWLMEMGLRFAIEGIDFAEIDSLSQYSFFRYANFIALIGRRMIEANPDIDRFFILRGPEPLPLDFDFDTDIGYAVLRWLCEKMGQRSTIIVSGHHLLAHGANFLGRPYSRGWVTPHSIPATRDDLPKPAIGFIPSTVPSGLRIIRDAGTLNCDLTLFYSPWAVSAPRSTTDEEEEAMLSPADRDWSARVAAQLAELRKILDQRRERSTLPDYIIGNPYLDFQFDHILLRRWLVIANIAHHAARHVEANPLQIFINPEMANWEGMVLAALYRRQGAKILVAPHSGWPGQAFDASWQKGDWAMVYSRLGTLRLEALSGLDRVYTIGMPWIALDRPPGSDERIAEKLRLAGGRKIVVFVTNPIEISFLPSLDQRAHFATVAKLAEIPEALRGKIQLALRRRAPRGGESDVVYREVCGIDMEPLHFLDGLTFHECVRLADCVIGVNLQTSGYYEVMQNKKPLIFLQDQSVIYQQPELPPDAMLQVDTVERLWQAVERVLFDDSYREALIERQSRFAEEDLRPEFSGEESPIRSLLHKMLTENQ